MEREDGHVKAEGEIGVMSLHSYKPDMPRIAVATSSSGKARGRCPVRASRGNQPDACLNLDFWTPKQ